MTEVLNRKQAPVFKSIESVELLEADHHSLDNGLNLFSINAGTQDVTRVEFLFKAGSFYESAPLIAMATGKLLLEGTEKLRSDEIASRLDYYGAFWETKVDRDTSSLILYSLNKYLNETLRVLKEAFLNASFPEEEVQVFAYRNKQTHITNLEKVSYLASKNYMESLFGTSHPYGYKVKTDDFENLSRDKILEFYSNFYSPLNCDIILSGLVGTKQIDIVNNLFGKENVSSQETQVLNFEVGSGNQRKSFQEKKGAVQSAIKIGRSLFNKKHQDYHKLNVLSTALGGYFGSRLMANIREDKGYTYGIGSGLVSMLKRGYFVISTEVGANVTGKALEEIYKEIEILQNDLIPEDELQMVKNYMLGRFQKSTDGPFSWSDAFVGIHKYGLDYSYYRNFFKVVRDINSTELRQIAQKYLAKDDLFEIVVGKKE